MNDRNYFELQDWEDVVYVAILNLVLENKGAVFEVSNLVVKRVQILIANIYSLVMRILDSLLTSIGTRYVLDVILPLLGTDESPRRCTTLRISSCYSMEATR